MLELTVTTSANPKGIDFTFDDPKGDVGRWLHRKGVLVTAGAKRQVGTDTGQLRSSINMTHHRGLLGQYVTVGSDDPIAFLHHEGTRPHWITPNPPKTHLSFQSGGRRIVTRAVYHPGTRPNRYLTDNLSVLRG